MERAAASREGFGRRNPSRRKAKACDASPGGFTAARDDLFTVALCNMHHGVCMFDRDRYLILCNPAYARLYDLPDHLTEPGTALEAILAFRHGIGNGPLDMERYFDVVQLAEARGSHAVSRTRLTDGRTIQITFNPLRDGSYVAIHEDVSAAIEAEARIHFLAAHDSMTGLPNRSSLTDRLDQERERRGGGSPFAIHGLDLDQFKLVNDTLGHLKGDALLKAVTARFLSCCRETDFIARLGGDEFVVLQPGSDTPDKAGALARRLIEEISRPFDLDGDIVTIGVSIGIAFFPGDALTSEDLLRSADVALYRAKLDGRNTFRFFEMAMDSPLQERRRLEIDLRTALATNAFHLNYQPLVDAQTAEITGFEALLRWTHPENGPMPPRDFIPLCEDNGLIVPLGRWVLRQACEDAMHWPSHLTVAVNLSIVQFRDGTIVETVRSALSTSGMDASRLELEITESVLLVEAERTLGLLHALRGLGVRIALDDFGTGDSSLSYLRSFPFDKIKIDQTFIGGGGSPGSEAIVRAVTSLGTALNMTTTAEGVETDGQFRRMREHGCREIQGYFFGKPQPAADIPALLDAAQVGRPRRIVAA